VLEKESSAYEKAAGFFFLLLCQDIFSVSSQFLIHWAPKFLYLEPSWLSRD